jgi:hypothetical protein
MPAIANEIHNFSLSSGSVRLAAYLKYYGANENKSTILSMVDLGSNILTGREM